MIRIRRWPVACANASLCIGLLIVAAMLTTAAPATAVDQPAFIERVGAGAKPSQAQYGVPPSVTIAQAILESAWGQSKIALEAKNYFGIKCRDGKPGPIAIGCVSFPTWECDGGCHDTVAIFRTYASIDDSFRDHARFLRESPRYAAAFNHTGDADQFIREVHKAGYATDPAYSDKIIKLMNTYNLYRFN